MHWTQWTSIVFIERDQQEAMIQQIAVQWLCPIDTIKWTQHGHPLCPLDISIVSIVSIEHQWTPSTILDDVQWTSIMSIDTMDTAHKPTWLFTFIFIIISRDRPYGLICFVSYQHPLSGYVRYEQEELNAKLNFLMRATAACNILTPLERAWVVGEAYTNKPWSLKACYGGGYKRRKKYPKTSKLCCVQLLFYVIAPPPFYADMKHGSLDKQHVCYWYCVTAAFSNWVIELPSERLWRARIEHWTVTSFCILCAVRVSKYFLGFGKRVGSKSKYSTLLTK